MGCDPSLGENKNSAFLAIHAIWDASRFGLAYLSKFGWDASQGLGSSGEGMKTHVKVQQKLDMMGIGAQHQRDPNGIAWKQNKDFEALLKRLNESADGGDTEGEGETAMGSAFVRAQEEKEAGNESRKRKHEEGDDANASKSTKEKEKEKRHKSSLNDSASLSVDSTVEPFPVLSSSKPHSEIAPKPRPMAHRARIRAAKRIAGKSASAIAEILGIAPSSSTSTSTPTPAPTPPPSTPQHSVSQDNLTTSTKSVADYFKEKLFALSSSSSSPVLSSIPSGSATPGLGATGSRLGSFPVDGEDVLARRGIGSQSFIIPPFSQAPESGQASTGSDNDGDSQDALTEKQCRKAERKVEKRKRREAEASAAVVPTVKEQSEAEDAMRRTQKVSRKEKKRKKYGKGEDEDSDEETEKRHEHDTPSHPLPKPRKKSKKEHEK